MTFERERDGDFSTGASPFSDDFAATATIGEGQVNVIHGIYAHSYPLAGMTVAECRAELQERLRIDPESTAVIDGVEMDEGATIHEGQVLSFVKRSGEKG